MYATHDYVLPVKCADCGEAIPYYEAQTDMRGQELCEYCYRERYEETDQV